MAREVRLTRAGYERLQKELEHERERMEEAIKILQGLTGTSDDYDDSGLEEAKREKSNIELRIDDLEDQLTRAVIIEEHKVDEVGLGSVVSLQTGDDSFEVQLVSSIEASALDSDIPKVSDESPMGQALLGQKPKSKFKVTIKGKTTEYTVKAIS